MKINIEWRRSGVGRFRSAVQSVKRATRKGAWNMINRTAIYTAASAHKAARLGKPKRKMIVDDNPLRNARFYGYKYAIRNYSKTQSRWAARRTGAIAISGGQYWYTNDKSEADRLRDIWTRGAAKASWAGILRKLNAPYRIVSDRLRTVLFRTNWVRFQRSAPMSITFVNSLRYMAKIQPTILTDALAKAQRRLMGAEKAAMERAQLRAWKMAG
jgi:hypothetical protein